MVLNTPDPQFVVALTEHRLLGHILVPFFVVPNQQGTFYTIVSQVLKSDLLQKPESFSKVEKQMVELMDKYSDDALARKFSRKQGSKEFFQKIDSKFFNEFITPYIDKQIVECLRLIGENHIRLYFKAAKYNNLYDEDLIQVNNDFALPTFHFKLNEQGLTYWLNIQYKHQNLKLFHKKPLMVCDTPCRMVLRNELISFEKLSGKRLAPFFEKEVMNIPMAVMDKYMKGFIFKLVQEHKVEASGFEIISMENEKHAMIFIETGLDTNPMLILKFRYGSKIFSAGKTGQIEVELKKENGQYRFYKHIRDTNWEKQIIDGLQRLGLRLNGSMLLLSKDHILAWEDAAYAAICWVNQHHTELEALGIQLKQAIDGTRYYFGQQKLDYKLTLHDDWFDLHAIVTFGEFQFPFIRLRKYILNGKREFQLPNGETVILPTEWFARFKDLLPHAEQTKEGLKISKHHFKLLEDKFGPVDDSLKTRLQALRFDPDNLLPEPEGLKASMRQYQQEGFSWMYLLGQNKFGGCLADDMGLGKTIQTLALLLKEKIGNKEKTLSVAAQAGQQLDLFSTVGQQKPASLVIVPTSLVHNWKNEILKFAPQLKTYLHQGIQRKRSSIRRIIESYDVILTTYGTIRNDFQFLQNFRFNYLILDESQNIKNSESKTYQSVIALEAEKKLVLTGTPIENSLSDLWSQFNFLNPDLLGSMQYFKNTFIQPIEKQNDEESQRKLNLLISPFILRRTKEQVARDLPPLTEQIRYCTMTEEQARIYEEQKSLIRNKLLENIELQGIEKATFIALQGLTRLRQLANHPALYQFPESDSGKFNEVLQSLENLIAENHKVLIFSSFVTHLKLFETEFENRNWSYSCLTGQTKNREEVISDFQLNENKRLFLISLKAGGVGLNLTSADYIFMLDPWWNPAAENQAINRAHRIGQDKKVFVYRFITENSIEEKIQVLKERKTALAGMFITGKNPLQAISKEEMVELFQ